MAAKRKLRVLFVTPEVRPLVKTGGLGDVANSLPAALRRLGVDVRLLVPGYPSVLEGVKNKRLRARFSSLAAGEVRLHSAVMPDNGVPVWVVEYPPLYERDGGPYQDPYGHDWVDNAQRFALLSKVAAILGDGANPLPWRPDVVHCNDWQAGLAPAYLHYMPGRRPATVVTIHNLAFQGIYPPGTATLVGLPPESFHMEGVEYYGNLSFLKAGLYYADAITTVSPTYAREIQTEALGMGMHGLLAHRSGHLTGILNGVDQDEWNPAADAYLAQPYDAGRLAAKAASKRALQERLGLTPDPDAPLLGIVSRITHQKGVDLLLEIAPGLVAAGAQLAVLGKGEHQLEAAFKKLAHRHPKAVGAVMGFDEGLSHQIEAGADMFLMPSRFEPCGLNQMYSQRYGTPPVVHATGGLADTVVDTTAETLRDGTATGFVFHNMIADEFHGCILRAIDAYGDKGIWRRIQRNGMGRDFSWRRSAEEYLALYEKLAPAQEP
jgi:starch synthase